MLEKPEPQHVYGYQGTPAQDAIRTSALTVCPACKSRKSVLFKHVSLEGFYVPRKDKLWLFAGSFGAGFYSTETPEASSGLSKSNDGFLDGVQCKVCETKFAVEYVFDCEECLKSRWVLYYVASARPDYSNNLEKALRELTRKLEADAKMFVHTRKLEGQFEAFLRGTPTGKYLFGSPGVSTLKPFDPETYQ